MMGNYQVRFRGRGRGQSHREPSPLPDLSDGTLVEAAYGEGNRCRFAVGEEGAGIARVQHLGDSDILRRDWWVEWVTVAAAANAARATAPRESLPVIPGLLG
jgi:hypothetical protein